MGDITKGTKGKGKHKSGVQLKNAGFRIWPKELEALRVKSRNKGGYTVVLRVLARMYLAGEIKLTVKDIDTHR